MRAIFIPIKSLFVAISFGLGWCGLFSAHMTLFNEGQNTVRETKLPLELNKLQYHGTTTLSFKHKDSLVLCVDSKASIGNYVGSRCVKKVFPVSANIVATMAGGAADCAYWIRRISRLKSMMEYKLDARLGARAVARMLSSSLREYKGQGLSVGTMVAGWDEREGPSLFYVDSEGACIEGNMFCVGSGSQLAYAILDTVSSEGEPVRKKEVLVEAVAAPLMMTELPSEAETDDSTFSENVTATSRIPMPPRDIIANTAEGLAALSLEDAIRTAVKAVRHATYRDGFSGGYINVLVVNATGIHHVKRVDSKTIPL